MKPLLLAGAILFTVVAATAQNKPDVWQPLRAFVGEWKGAGGGEPGRGEYNRSYRAIFNAKFIEVRNQTVYPKQPEITKGETHEDVGYISYDKVRKVFVFRQFHSEGFVNQYRLESISPDGKTIVFVSEALENLPAGFRARETYRISGLNEFTETFEIAEPDREFAVYSSVTLKRMP
ncbi:MAG: hypothetical protein ABIZ95_03115 [Pyrinomonadaceae bacterium]